MNEKIIHGIIEKDVPRLHLIRLSEVGVLAGAPGVIQSCLLEEFARVEWAAIRSLGEGWRSHVPYGTWRRGWDSNPRSSFPDTRFPSVLLKPLGHLSATTH